jgi:hypothetical protein
VNAKDLDAALVDIQKIVEYGVRADDELRLLRNSGLTAGMEDELRADLSQRAERSRQWCREQLRALIEFPPQHLRHFPRLEQFWRDGTYERSVFLMTKFPEPGADPKAIELQRVIDAVSAAVKTADFVPRIAQFPNNYHPGLWDNVELHLLACRQGIAIVEDQYLPELNPNVAMEWGWMRGMGKPVLFLLEAAFDHRRADLGDLIDQRFEWTNPHPGIAATVGPWLQRIELDLPSPAR